MIQFWRISEMHALTVTGRTVEAGSSGAPSAFDEAISVGAAARPSRSPQIATVPDIELPGRDQYIQYRPGTSPLSSRLSQPAIMNTWSDAPIASRDLPWHLAWLGSLPLHFGHFGGTWLRVA